MSTFRRAGVGAAVGAMAAGIGWAVRDYRRWKALGPGGVPSNPVGWVAVTGMRMRTRDPYTVDAPRGGEVERALRALPRREGPRPDVAPHPVPHRVLNQHADQARIAAVQDMVQDLAGRPGLEMRMSGWEKHHPALFAADGTELGHVHPRDGSLHVSLRPPDAAVVVDLGWGELHRLAGVMLGLPAGYVLLYPPREQAEIACLRSILEAAAAVR
ncbi:hypothetical protein VSH64_18905 [Amycolatopsis rhabdoformis]|uniref:Luciferase domain-containing protein n=1 Tax=Amycolatopsis rhabdoformis TaxID=1448059 RepID=A0ABZ1IJJ4_9PSEU|nr:hypothetical protein [Amycolatopsis rhabdoformis]WSE34142.1 hypothetical protein VSH64_18905 [Amycolatopsis rhabdoformis]